MDRLSWTEGWKEFLCEEWSKGVFSDIKIRTSDGSEFQSHRILLASCWFLPQDNEEADVILLEEFDSSTVKAFMELLYSGSVEFTGDASCSVGGVKGLADLFGIRNLRLEETYVYEDDVYYESDESDEIIKPHGSLTVTLEENLSKREILVRNEEELVCEECGKRFLTREEFKSHSSSIHQISNTPFVCSRCGEGFRTICKMQIHEKSHEEDDDDDYEEEDEDDDDEILESESTKDCVLVCNSSKKTSSTCEKCGKEFKGLKTLKYHVKYACSDVKNRIFQCGSCPLKFSSPRNARRHESSVHKESLAYKCHLCSISCKSPKFLRNHIRVVHNPQELPYKCITCGKSFLKGAYLRDHIRRFHAAEKEFACRVCTKRYSTKQDLHRHAKSHGENGDRKLDFSCSYCESAFAHRSTLTQHVRKMHTGDKPYKCKPCDKSFGLLGVLKKHKKSHDRKGDATVIISAPKGRRGMSSYIDYAANHNPSQSLQDIYIPAEQFARPIPISYSEHDLVNYSEQQIPYGSYPTFPKSDILQEEQITTMDIMDLLNDGKNQM